MHNKDSKFWATFQPNLHFFFASHKAPSPHPSLYSPTIWFDSLIIIRHIAQYSTITRIRNTSPLTHAARAHARFLAKRLAFSQMI